MGGASRDLLKASVAGRAALSVALSNAEARASIDGAWRDGALALLNSNAGEAVLTAFFQLVGDASLRGVGEALALLCREAGSRPCLTALDHWQGLGRPDWWASLSRLAREAPDCLEPAVAHAGEAMRTHGIAGFGRFVAIGLRAFSASPGRRLRYFRLEEDLARRTLSGAADSDLMARERRLRLFIGALCGVAVPLRPHPPAPDRPVARRTSLIDGVILMPETFPGAPPAALDRLFLASAAHAAAHLMFGHGRQKVGSLKPLQLAVIGLIEDARVEAMAIRRFPGLLRLWTPFHVARAEGNSSAALFARLSRALIDPDFDDQNALCEKARRLFMDADLEDPTMSRRIGGLIGNDIGQMRVQFNARTWVIEPAYRDDNLGLWDYSDQVDEPAQELDIQIEAVRRRQEYSEDGTKSDLQQRQDGAAARPRIEYHDDGVILAKYPEWDETARRELREWTTIVGLPPQPGPPSQPNVFEGAERHLARRILGVAKSAELGRRMRQRRQRDGDRLDIDACIEVLSERRVGSSSDAHVFLSHKPGPRSLAVLLLIDLSESTRDIGSDGRSVLDAERDAARILAAALTESGDLLAVHGFHSDGRERVMYHVLKDFQEPFDTIVQARLGGLTSGFSTRLGAAIRHATNELSHQNAFRRVLVVLTDGEPSDIDVTDPDYLISDARHATVAARRAGVDIFAMGLGASAFEALNRIVGPARTLPVPTLSALPARVTKLYQDLKK